MNLISFYYKCFDEIIFLEIGSDFKARVPLRVGCQQERAQKKQGIDLWRD